MTARALLEAVESLVSACEEAFTSPDTDMMEDVDEDVSVPGIGITFGMIWKARDAVNRIASSLAEQPAKGEVRRMFKDLNSDVRHEVRGLE